MNNKKCIFSLICLLALSTGCGIDVYYQMEPPKYVTATINTSVFENYISMDDSYNEVFRGIEIFYKFFNSSDAAQSNSNITTITTLKSSGYKRLSRAGDFNTISKPLIEIPTEYKEGVSSFVINFSDPEEVKITATPTGVGDGITILDSANFVVYREDKNSDSFKNFKAYKSDDSDISGLNLTQPIYVSLYALTYGIDISKELYSEPEWLTSIQIFNPVIE